MSLAGLPNVGLSAGANRTHVDIHTSVPIPGMASSFNNTQQNVQLSAQQPLYRPANKIAYEQGQRGEGAEHGAQHERDARRLGHQRVRPKREAGSGDRGEAERDEGCPAA